MRLTEQTEGFEDEALVLMLRQMYLPSVILRRGLLRQGLTSGVLTSGVYLGGSYVRD